MVLAAACCLGWFSLAGIETLDGTENKIIIEERHLMLQRLETMANIFKTLRATMNRLGSKHIHLFIWPSPKSNWH